MPLPSDSAVLPRPASTVLALRAGHAGFEVLMVRRGTDALFMGGAHVFPGGGLEPADSGEVAAAAVGWRGDPVELPWRAAALRELAEETGVVLSDRPVDVAGSSGRGVYEAVVAAGARLDADRLAYLSNWVTPVGVPRRFDTRFYLTAVDAGTEAVSDETEVFDAVWVEPAEALRLGNDGTWRIEFPTQVHLELLAGFDSVEEAMAHAERAVPERVEPRLAADADGSVRILLPDDPGYVEASGAR